MSAAVKAERAETTVAELSKSIKRDVKALQDATFTKEEARNFITEEIERNIAVSGSSTTGNLNGSTELIMGGLKESTFEVASAWIARVLSTNLPTEVYQKQRDDEPFQGMVFLKFQSRAAASAALKSLQDCIKKENADKGFKERSWANNDLPIEQRVVRGFLFGLRWQLTEWKYPRACIEVDPNAGTLKVEGKECVKAEIDRYGFKVTWVDESWRTWDWLQTSEELKQLKKTASDKLEASRSRKKKGAGKGQQ